MFSILAKLRWGLCWLDGGGGVGFGGECRGIGGGGGDGGGSVGGDRGCDGRLGQEGSVGDWRGRGQRMRRLPAVGAGVGAVSNMKPLNC